MTEGGVNHWVVSGVNHWAVGGVNHWAVGGVNHWAVVRRMTDITASADMSYIRRG